VFVARKLVKAHLLAVLVVAL